MIRNRYFDPTRPVSETERMMLVFGMIFSLIGTIVPLFVSAILASTHRDFSSPIAASFAAFTVALSCLVRYRMSVK